jgi:hypothetical protein
MVFADNAQVRRCRSAEVIVQRDGQFSVSSGFAAAAWELALCSGDEKANNP